MGRGIASEATQRRGPPRDGEPAARPGGPRRVERVSALRGRSSPSAPPRRRCSWATREPLIAYHDREWGVPQHGDRRLFEFLILEGMQAGLSWETILRKRPAFRRAFASFDPVKVARFGARDVARLMKDESIIRNRAKIEAAIANAKAFGEVRRKFGSFDRYVWEFTDKVVLAKDLKRRGFGFVGPTIAESFMQAVGMLNDHEPGCYRRREISTRLRDKRAVPHV